MSCAGPIVQVHITRHCNLRCRHCYTASGPGERESLDVDTIARFLGDAWVQGYRIVSLSGGEPMIHPQFFDIVAAARQLGYVVNLATNGLLIDAERAERLASEVDLVAVSIDGPSEIHNMMRRSKAAYDGALRGLGNLRAAGARFAVIHTLTHDTLRHLRWLHKTVKELGAQALQLHLLEGVGRARDELADVLPGVDLATRAALLAKLIEVGSPDGPEIHVDVLPSGLARFAPDMANPDYGDCDGETSLSEIIDPLVLESDGRVLPVTSGISDRFRICTLPRDSLHGAVSEFRQKVYPRFRRFCHEVFDDRVLKSDQLYINWFGALGDASRLGEC